MHDFVNIIIVGYRVNDTIAEYERVCIDSVFTSAYKKFVLTYVDNYTSGLTLTAAWNTLIDQSKCDYICLLNNDTEIVQPEWLDLLLPPLKDKHIGFTGPSTNVCHSVQNTIKTLSDARRETGNTKVSEQPLSGFCLLFRKKLWKELGGFNEKYALYGQESDFCARAHMRGYKSLWVKGAFVFHRGESSVKAAKIDVVNEREKAKKLYWGDRQ